MNTKSAGISGGHRRREERDPGGGEILPLPAVPVPATYPNVEREMGEKLFERRNGELHLTDAGTIYINGARAILAAERPGDGGDCRAGRARRPMSRDNSAKKSAAG